MTYKLREIKTFSKFSILDLDRGYSNKWGKIDLSRLFWNTIFNKDVFMSFINDKYLPSVKGQISEIEYKNIEKEAEFIYEKLNWVKKKIDFANNIEAPEGDEVFFSFRLFTSIAYFYNSFYNTSEIEILLRTGLQYQKGYIDENEFLENILFYSKTDFIKDIFLPMIEKLDLTEKVLYKFEIFWPEELITISIFSKLIKELNPSSKILVDFSVGNEQFDFSQWIELIKSADNKFFEFIDYFAVHRDFDSGVKQVLGNLNGLLKKEDISNIIFYDNGVQYKDVEENDLDDDLFESFINKTFNQKNFTKLMGERSYYSRFLPYKCYYSNCSFCAINSQNKFSYDAKYSYDYFINKWVEFIEENDIKAINFKDEALPPVVIIKFSKKLIEKGLKVNYQFRTRYEQMYTYENCKIMKKAGCGFCGIGLESAVDRVNEEIGNKGNKGLKINDKVRILHNFDKAGISFHNYSIIGFPGETEQEAAITYKFLRDNIINSNFFTCTPNLFGLMKGPKIFSEMEKYGVEVDKEELDNPLKLVYDFTYKGKPRNISLLKKFEESLHKTQFLPWIDPNNTKVSGRAFWDYIDRGYIFYLLKRYSDTNPFYKYKNVNNNLLKQDYDIILNTEVKISKYFYLFEYNTELYIYDWVGVKDTIVNKKFKSFLDSYDENITIGENLYNNGLNNSSETREFIIKILKDRILMNK